MPGSTDDHQLLDGRSGVILSLLAFVGGFADAGSYILTESFSGHLTGNIVLTTVHLSSGNWAKAGTCLLAVGGLAIGTAWGSRANRGAVSGRSSLTDLRWPLIVELLLFATALASAKLLGPVRGHSALIGWLGLALGVQNGALQKLGLLGVHTTYITGVSTSLIDAAWAGKGGRFRRDALAGLVISFACGAACGGVFVARGDIAGFAFLLFPIILALLLSRA